MIFAVNLFNLVSGKENEYREYSVQAGKLIYGVGGKVVVSGSEPLRLLAGDKERRYFILVEFPDEGAFQSFLDRADELHLHALREGATSDYIWQLFKPWDLRAWVKEVL